MKYILNNKDIIDKKPPMFWRLFIFLTISIIHIILLLFIFYDLKFILLFLIELIFFIYFNKSKLLIKIFFKIIIIISIIFLLNIIFYDGKIILNIGFIKITYEGLIEGIKKIGLFVSTVFFTCNCFNKNNEKIIKYYNSTNNKNNLLIKSINYFFVFFESIGEKYSIKKLFIKLIRIYKNNNKNNIKEITNVNILKFDFIIYNFIFFVFFIFLFLY